MDAAGRDDARARLWRSSLAPPPRLSRRWLLLLLAATFLSAHACIALTRQSNGLAAIWLPNAILLAALLRRPERHWPTILLWGSLALLMANVANGRDLVLSLGLPLCNLPEVLLCAAVLRSLRDASLRLDLASTRPLATFLTLALGPGPLLSAALAVALLGLTHGADAVSVFRLWYAAHAVGLLTLTPLLVALEPAAVVALFRRGKRLRTATCLLLMVATLEVVFTQDHYPLLFLVFPPLMLVNFQLGLAGVVLSLAMTVVAAIGATQAGMGPLLLIQGGAREQMMVLQGFVAVAGLTALQLASVLAARGRLEAQLRRVNAEAKAEIAARRLSEAAARAARREAEAAREEALAASRSKSDFLATMSHEIRTPLNSIIGFAGLMLDDAALTGALRQRAGVISSAGTALLTVVGDVLDMARIEAGRIDLDPQPFAPRLLFANAVAMLQGQAAAKGLTLDAEIDPALPTALVGDSGRVQQVLLNLLNNAVKFTETGRVTSAVRVAGAGATGVALRITVSDTGPGIAADAQDRLFRRFSQADASVARRYGGSGLGLAISKELVERMGGTIGVVSEVGRGSTFWFQIELPLGTEAGAADAAAPSEPPRGRRLLVVEDMDANQMLARALLEGDGHQVTIARSGEAAVAAVREGNFDLVLMDVRMPGLDGVTATRRIRSEPGGQGLPIVAMTANVCADEVAAMRAAGMVDHVAKPIDRARLRAVIARWLPDAPPGPVEADVPPVARRAAGSEAAAFEPATLERIAALLGRERTRGLLLSFRRDLALRFAPSASVETLRADAHVVTAIAGSLGFAALSLLCSRLADGRGAPGVGPGRGEEIAALQRARTEALQKLATLLEEVPDTMAA